ncbi:MAG: hypothetical protein EZS28_048064, partial [Streblomastix strix]
PQKTTYLWSTTLNRACSALKERLNDSMTKLFLRYVEEMKLVKVR